MLDPLKSIGSLNHMDLPGLNTSCHVMLNTVLPNAGTDLIRTVLSYLGTHKLSGENVIILRSIILRESLSFITGTSISCFLLIFVFCFVKMSAMHTCVNNQPTQGRLGRR